jgi:ABC-2 type transport system permease protein
MTALTHTAGDSATMLRRNLRHQLRYPSVTVMLVGMPVVFLLLFVYVFGGTMGAGLAGVAAGAGRAQYLEFVVPGILVITLTATAQGTAISVAMDMTAGIVARFRTMSISRAAVLTGHVLGSLLQALAAIVAVTAVALAVGFRSDANAVEWLAALGMLAMIAFALTWFAVALGVAADSVESASNLPMFLILLPFLGSGFVPTDSMPAGLQWFAEHQPFTPFIDTVRGLLTGSPIGSSAVVSIVWCVAISTGSYLWARSLYIRRSVRAR